MTNCPCNMYLSTQVPEKHVHCAGEPTDWLGLAGNTCVTEQLRKSGAGTQQGALSQPEPFCLHGTKSFFNTPYLWRHVTTVSSKPLNLNGYIFRKVQKKSPVKNVLRRKHLFCWRDGGPRRAPKPLLELLVSWWKLIALADFKRLKSTSNIVSY